MMYSEEQWGKLLTNADVLRNVAAESYPNDEMNVWSMANAIYETFEAIHEEDIEGYIPEFHLTDVKEVIDELGRQAIVRDNQPSRFCLTTEFGEITSILGD